MASTLGTIRTAVKTALAATSLTSVVDGGWPLEGLTRPYGELVFYEGEDDLEDENSVQYCDYRWALIIYAQTIEAGDLAMEECATALTAVGSLYSAVGSDAIFWRQERRYPPVWTDPVIGVEAALEGYVKVAYDYTP